MTILDFTTQLALETGDILLSFYNPAGINSELKQDHTVVTEADIAADKHLRHSIAQAYPGDGIISEEAGTLYPEGHQAVWVIDPLDGTTNFSLGLHYWGISIARLVQGLPDIAVLYLPLFDELFTAAQGQGACLNGTKLKVKPPDPVDKRSFFSCCSRSHRSYDIDIRYKTRILGSAAFGLATVARGSAVLALEVTPKIWDFSASWLITQEAGGHIASLDGASPYPLVPGTDYGDLSFPILAAASPKAWENGSKKIKAR